MKKTLDQMRESWNRPYDKIREKMNDEIEEKAKEVLKHGNNNCGNKHTT